MNRIRPLTTLSAAALQIYPAAPKISIKHPDTFDVAGTSLGHHVAAPAPSSSTSYSGGASGF